MNILEFFGVPANWRKFPFRTDVLGWCKKDVLAYLEESDETAAGLAVVLNEEIDSLKNENTQLKTIIERIYESESANVKTRRPCVTETEKLAAIRKEITNLRKNATAAISKFERELAALDMIN